MPEGEAAIANFARNSGENILPGRLIVMLLSAMSLREQLPIFTSDLLSINDMSQKLGPALIASRIRTLPVVT
jgi:hypothetical protein